MTILSTASALTYEAFMEAISSLSERVTGWTRIRLECGPYWHVAAKEIAQKIAYSEHGLDVEILLGKPAFHAVWKVGVVKDGITTWVENEGA